MPRIFDNIEQDLLPALQQTLEITDHADVCVGYFNLRGWKQLDHFVEQWPGGDDHCCRLLVGMQRLPIQERQAGLSPSDGNSQLDNQTALRMKKQLAQEFRDQLVIGTPNNEDEACLRRLARQIKARKVVVKLFLRHPLHAKLYLLFRPDDPANKIIDLITYNLDIFQVAEDAIECCEGPEILRAFCTSITNVSVLDPTCGSGAFLFAALNILEPLYDACLVRMQAFLDDLEHAKHKPHPETFADFRKILFEANDARRHPNHRYFILKSIILNNLYGVDIMEEAVEICKLRLFLASRRC